MPLPSELTAELDATSIPWQANAPLHRKVWWKVGGPADALVTVRSTAELATVLQLAHAHQQPVFALGNGSNLLVGDGGIRGLVLQLAGQLADTSLLPNGQLQVGAGLKVAVLLARAKKHRWSGLHFLGGIPGTFGGVVRMNGGTHLGEVSDLLVDVDLVHPNGHTETLPASALHMAYRTCVLPPGTVISQARLRLSDLPYDESEALLTAHLDRRKRTQPIHQRTCGSTFRNPPGDHAGRLIEAAGLKGFTLGGAQVSPMHANFLVNTGTATAADLRQLIEHIETTVQQQFGITLHREVHLVGDFTAHP